MGTYTPDKVMDLVLDWAPLIIGGFIAYKVVDSLLDQRPEEKKKAKQVNFFDNRSIAQQLWEMR